MYSNGSSSMTNEGVKSDVNYLFRVHEAHSFRPRAKAVNNIIRAVIWFDGDYKKATKM